MTRATLEANLRCERLVGGHYRCRSRSAAKAEAERRILASGIETRSAIDSEAGVARKGESPTANGGDAQQ